MKRMLYSVVGLLGVVLAGPAGAGAPPPVKAMSPLLYVRFGGPPSLKVTFFEAGRESQTIACPVTVGLRPGYTYRVKLTSIVPNHPEIVWYPSLEVRGTLAVGPDCRPSDYPVPVTLLPFDIDQVRNGLFLTKVYYLENPETAIGQASRCDLPIETEILPTHDPCQEARERGRLMLVWRLGEREVDLDDLIHHSVPGTTLLPEMKALLPPAVPPYVPWACYNIYDPILGPKPPVEECIKDGGDQGAPVGFGPDGKLGGLDPADTVAEYKDCKGDRHLKVFNRVCLYAPRFAVIRVELAPAGYDQVVALGLLKKTKGFVVTQSVTPPLEARQLAQLEVLKGRELPSNVQNTQGVTEIERLEAPITLIGRVQGAEVVGVCEKPCLPEKLVVCKSADKQAVHIGEIVTFALQYRNVGGSSITNLAVTDSLTGRLEYVPGSARSDRDASFSTRMNDAGSSILRWEIGSALLPGQTGTLTFQARVR